MDETTYFLVMCSNAFLTKGLVTGNAVAIDWWPANENGAQQIAEAASQLHRNSSLASVSAVDGLYTVERSTPRRWNQVSLADCSIKDYPKIRRFNADIS